jgi:ZIP family zinc transporter
LKDSVKGGLLSAFTQMLVYTTCSGACILLGGLLSCIEKIHPRWLETEIRHTVIAFGGGVLASAVALVLVPEGEDYVSSPLLATAIFFAGGIGFFLFERFLGMRGREAPQLSAMLLDYLPESVALGAIFAVQSPTAPLLAILIGLQNLPEGFNAYREQVARKDVTSARTLMTMLILIPLGPAFGTLGWFYGPENTALVGALMLFAAGGILYLIFQDIAPQSHLRNHWAPPLGAVVGFSTGMLGNALL